MQTVSNSLTNVKSKPSFTLALSSQGMQKMLATAFSNNTKAIERFTSNITAAVSANPTLKDCDPTSIVSCGLQANAMNLSLSLSLGQAYLVKYGNQCVYQLGKNGIVQLALRSNLYTELDVFDVRQGELLGRDRRTGQFNFDFIPDEEQRMKLPVIGYLAFFELTNGFRKTLYMSKGEVIEHAKRYSKTFNLEMLEKYEEHQRTGKGLTAEEVEKCEKNPWVGSFNSMAEKTLLRRLLLKYGPMSLDMMDAFDNENKPKNPVPVEEIFTETEQPVEVESEPIIAEKVVVVDAPKDVKPKKAKTETVPQQQELSDDIFG